MTISRPLGSQNFNIQADFNWKKSRSFDDYALRFGNTWWSWPLGASWVTILVVVQHDNDVGLNTTKGFCLLKLGHLACPKIESCLWSSFAVKLLLQYFWRIWSRKVTPGKDWKNEMVELKKLLCHFKLSNVLDAHFQCILCS